MASTPEKLRQVPLDILGAPQVSAVLGEGVHLCLLLLHQRDGDAHLGSNLHNRLSGRRRVCLVGDLKTMPDKMCCLKVACEFIFFGLARHTTKLLFG